MGRRTTVPEERRRATAADGRRRAIVSSERRRVTVAYVRRRTDKPLDAWWAVLVLDHLSVRLVWLLDRVAPRTSPNTITTVGLLAGVAAGVLFAQGRLVAGAIAYQVSLLLDGADGKHARMQGRSSITGELYDGFVNHVVYLSCLLGLGAHLLRVDDLLGVGLAVALVALRSLTLYANGYSGTGEGTWTPFTAGEGSWMTRHRLLPPGSFPDKQTLVFTVGPVLGLVTPALAVIVAMELALLAVKLRRAVRLLHAGDAPSPGAAAAEGAGGVPETGGGAAAGAGAVPGNASAGEGAPDARGS